ncbi:MAG: sodium-dependent bicarbonate transport family permease [Leptospiraceae bacterium]|nr:sodium-dependent bicarbonate transport family permease [Leptospiraceae bacterium]
MEFNLLIANITNPTLLFFLLGIFATFIKSDLEIPTEVSKFIALYLLFAIGFKGGQELSHSVFEYEIIYTLAAAVLSAAIVPIFTFFIVKRKMPIADSGAIAAAYGSVSAVTFITAIAFLESQKIAFGGHMVAILALMEAPAIIVGVALITKYKESSEKHISMSETIKHSFTNGSVLMIMGSLVIGFIAEEKQAQGIRPFTDDIFKGFLAIFLLDMGIITAQRFAAFRKYGIYAFSIAILLPLFNGSIMSYLTQFFIAEDGNRLLFTILTASASYIAVPAAMRLAAPDADPGLYIPMALGITFPFNITLGMPLFYTMIKYF